MIDDNMWMTKGQVISLVDEQVRLIQDQISSLQRLLQHLSNDVHSLQVLQTLEDDNTSLIKGLAVPSSQLHKLVAAEDDDVDVIQSDDWDDLTDSNQCNTSSSDLASECTAFSSI